MTLKQIMAVLIVLGTFSNVAFAMYNMITGFLPFWNGLGVFLLGGMFIGIISSALNVSIQEEKNEKSS